MKWKKYIFNVDVIVGVIIVCIITYCVWSSKTKTLESGTLQFAAGLQDLKNGYTPSSPMGYTSGPNVLPKQRKLNKHEEKCRKIFESLFGKKFESVRPDWLKNPATGRNLELDGFCPSIETPMGKGIAFEYDGAQHAQFSPYFHRDGGEQFVYQVKKDEWKDRRCKEKGVLLIRIPHHVAYEDLEMFIVKRLEEENVDFEAPDILMRGMYS